MPSANPKKMARAAVLLLYAGLFVAGGAVVYVWTSFKPVAEILGTHRANDTVSVYGKALYWAARAKLHNEVDAHPIKRVYGQIVGVDQAGRLIVEIVRDDHYVKKAVAMANLAHIDEIRLERFIQTVYGKPAIFDLVAEHEGTVIAWVDEEPVNIRVIEEGIADPDPHPETNIVDRVFSSYYWRLAKN